MLQLLVRVQNVLLWDQTLQKNSTRVVSKLSLQGDNPLKREGSTFFLSLLILKFLGRRETLQKDSMGMVMNLAVMKLLGWVSFISFLMQQLFEFGFLSN